jgi:hypothetical protein
MATDTSSAFNSAANPTPPSHGTSAGDAAPVTPSHQVASHAPAGMDGPSPPGSVGQAVQNQTHVGNMQRDGNRSDQANHYTRSQSPASSEQIKAISKLFAKQAEEKKAAQQVKTNEQSKNNQQDKDRGHER